MKHYKNSLSRCVRPTNLKFCQYVGESSLFFVFILLRVIYFRCQDSHFKVLYFILDMFCFLMKTLFQGRCFLVTSPKRKNFFIFFILVYTLNITLLILCLLQINTRGNINFNNIGSNAKIITKIKSNLVSTAIYKLQNKC